jgi:hypothetical protein
VVSEVNGSWQQAEEVRGTTPVNNSGSEGQSADVRSVSCASAGNCSAGGGFNNYNSKGRPEAFVVTQT